MWQLAKRPPHVTAMLLPLDSAETEFLYRYILTSPRIAKCPVSALMRQKGRIEKRGFLAIVAIEGAKMGQKSESVKKPANQVAKEIRRGGLW